MTCVYRSKAQYDRSNRILTKMLSSPLCWDVFSNECVNTIENFECSMTDKKQYLAFHVHTKSTMSVDAMTTSPIESMNSSIRNGMGVTLNSQTMWVWEWISVINRFN